VSAIQTSQPRLERDLQAVFAAGGGVMTLTVLGPASAAALVAAVMEGDPVARLVLCAADRLLRRIERRTRTMALPCLLCDDGMLWRGEAPAAVVGMGVCSGCAGDRRVGAITQMVVAALRAHMMPDLREFHAVAQIGHA
jgi:hypothetical protein